MAPGRPRWLLLGLLQSVAWVPWLWGTQRWLPKRSGFHATGDLEYFEVYSKDQFLQLLQERPAQERSVGEQEKIERMVSFLEGKNPTQRPAESVSLVGRWQLAFCGVNRGLKAGLNYVCSTCRVPDSAAAMFEDFNQGKAQQRYNDVCREEQVLQVLEHPAPLGYERMVVGIYQMPAPMKDREFLWREWAALLPTEDGGQLYVSVAMTPSPEESAAILPPNDKFVRGHLHLAATMARQDPDSYEVSAASVIMGDVKGSMPKAVQNMVAGNASSYLINFRDAHSR